MRESLTSETGHARAVGLVAVLAIALAAGLGIWLLADNDHASSAATPSSASAVVVSAQDLANAAAKAQHPVYWAGPIAGTSYELTTTEDGRIYVRYLPEGVEVGDPRPAFTTVGTYPDANAYAVLRKASKRRGAKAYNTRHGALVVTNTKTPTSVYFAFKGSPYLVEVFDPSAWKALQLTLSGQIRPIG